MLKNNLSGKVFLIEAFLFSLTLGLGIATASKIQAFLKIQKIEIPQISLDKFVLFFFSATFFLLLLIHFLKFRKGKGVVFKIIFLSAIFFGGLLFLETWIPEPFSLALILFLVFWWLKKPQVINQDILMIFGIAGVGATLGLSLQPLMVVVLLIIFSIYDFIAVYKTKHMIKIAKEMIESRAILGLVIPPSILGFQEKLEKVQPGGNFLILGGGDVIFPLLLSVSLVPADIFGSLIVAFFSLFGLLFCFFILSRQKPRRPIPALPPIAFFSIIGYLINLFF